MKLGATITSERGKAVTKTGNDRIEMHVMDENRRTIAYITVLPSGTVIIDDIDTKEEVIIREKENGGLKHDKCPECNSDMDDELSCCSNNDCDYFA